MESRELSNNELREQNKRKNQSSTFTLSEQTTTTVTGYSHSTEPETGRQNQNQTSPPRPGWTIPSSSPQPSAPAEIGNRFPPSHGEGTANLSQFPVTMRSSGASYFQNLISYTKKHPNVHIMFPIREENANSYDLPLSQKTLVNPSESGKRMGSSPDFVKLPFDPWNTKIKAEVKSGKKTQVRKWDIIQEELGKLKSIINSGDCGDKLRNAVTNYNSKKNGAVPFNLLNHSEITKKLIPLFEFISEEAAKIEGYFPRGIPVLRANSPGTIFMNQKQISSILANAFLCTFPDGRDQGLAEINFYELFSGPTYANEGEIKIEKLKCILHYFKRIKDGIPGNGFGSILSFERRSLHRDLEPDWEQSRRRLSPIQIVSTGCIENAENCLQVDFANQFVGGGVLGRGIVMEEIRFCICPELIASRLFTPKLEKNEVLIITGCEQFSKYSGYGNSFKFNGDHRDKTVEDELGRKKTKIVAMDAYNFSHDSKKQYSSQFLKRELDKCYIGFYEDKPEDKTPIATGNWGCGVFGGDSQLKVLLQWMAACQAEREMRYYIVGDSQWGREIQDMVEFLMDKQVVVGKLYKAIQYYNEKQIETGYKHPKTLFDFLKSLTY